MPPPISAIQLAPTASLLELRASLFAATTIAPDRQESACFGYGTTAGLGQCTLSDWIPLPRWLMQSGLATLRARSTRQLAMTQR